MSFMVENIFPSADVINKDVLKVTPSLRNIIHKCGVRAGEDIPCGAATQPFTVENLASLKVGEGEVIIGQRGCLEMRNHSSLTWHSSPNFSPDIHTCNIQIEIYSEEGFAKGFPHYFVMRAIKNIQRGSELFLWFSEEVLAMLNMPFLTPKNITGHRKYSCHHCFKAYESPNPLKIHLLLSCERESMSQLWHKIAKTLIKQRHFIGHTKLDYSPLYSRVERPSSVLNTSNLPKVDMTARCISEPPLSAFLPYKKQNMFSSDVRSEIIQPLNLTTHTTIPAPPPVNIIELRLTKSLEELSSNYAADIELFASNWGKMKQGHLCVYCGKVYSRKYGLKIHIRTHTGYKPLKCKYCQRPFGDPSNLNKHVRLHSSGVTPYMCSQCGKVLVRRRDLERHIKSQHSGEDMCSSDDNIDIDD